MLELLLPTGCWQAASDEIEKIFFSIFPKPTQTAEIEKVYFSIPVKSEPNAY
ncbi:hypothetical protein [Paenibacillus sp. Soil522]|uniref:hypothetical protein n=1 Tax=Paenibacillus sp. Soil522 TaxID=1736388 RepID=UPI0012DF16BB|nr:hypothetical protein [Paenibacillus sp. Soil522]